MKHWTTKETNQLKSLLKKGLPCHQIAETLGKSYSATFSRARLLGLSPVAAPAQTKLPETKTPVKVDPIKLPQPQFGGCLPLSLIDSGGWVRLGLVADTHLCCKEERLAELHQFYDFLHAEGIENTFHAGNICDGYIAKINGASVFDSTIDGQCQYVIDNYPSRKGMVTRYITGDDHEGWWQKQGFNFGAYLQWMANEQGREDLQYIGHVEADVALHVKGAKAPTMMKVQHPGGGSAYSRSYTGQKQVEAFEGGEKPSILVQGHYHVSNIMNERNIWTISLPGFQDQTIFARKKRLRMEIGGALLEFKVNPDDGSITRCRVELVRYFTRGYYQRYLKSDRKVLKGKLVLNV